MRIKTSHLVITTFIALSYLSHVTAFEPFSTTYLIGYGIAALGGAKYYDQIKVNTYCKYRECCTPELIPHRIYDLKDLLNRKLYGQHIVVEKVANAVSSHFKTLADSRKPLVMSFHGTAGVGKNYVANMIAEVLYEKGMHSKFFHIFHGSQYSDERAVETYKRKLQQAILDGIDTCEYSMFVFDEVDKMPRGVFNSITAMLDHHTLVNKRDFKKAIFIFLTNYGGDAITKVVHDIVNVKGIYRTELKLHHLEKVAMEETYNGGGADDGGNFFSGGLTESELIKTAVIDFYFPFLPLEESHVIECIKDEFLKICKKGATKEEIKEILQYVGFQKNTGFAHTGCKTIHPKVKAECRY